MNVIATTPNESPAISDGVSSKPRTLRRRFMSNALWSIGGRAASIGSVLGTSVILARTLSTGDYSAYTIAAAAVILLAMPAGFGAPRVLLRAIREAISNNQPQRAINSIWGCARLTALSCSIVVVGLALASMSLDLSEKWRALREYSILVGAWIGLSASCQATSHALQGFDEYRASAIVGARNGGWLANLMVLFAVALAASAGELSLRLALGAQVTMNAAVLAYGLYVLRSAVRRRAPDGRIGLPIRSDEVATFSWFFRESWPILVIQLTSLGLAQLDILIVGWLTDKQQVAAYGGVSRLCELLASGQVLAAALAAPFMSELNSTGQHAKFERLIRGITSLVAIPSALLAAAYILAPVAILGGVYRPEFIIGAAALQWASAGSLVACLSGLNSITMIMVGRQRELLRLSVAANLVYLAIAPWMILQWGITGAAAAGTLVFGPYNVIVSLVVKARIGVWTFASFRPSAYREALALARGVRRRGAENSSLRSEDGQPPTTIPDIP